MLGSIPESIARVAPVGRNDLAEKPWPSKPAKTMALSKIFETEDADKAKKGFLMLIKTALSVRWLFVRSM